MAAKEGLYIGSLTRHQVRTLALLAEGLSNEEIGTRDGVRHKVGPKGEKTVDSDAVKAQLRVIQRIIFGGGQVNRVRLAFWYVDNVLPFDTLPSFTRPGDKLQAWKANALRARGLIVSTGLVTAEVMILLELLADEQYADKSNQQLADEMTRRLGVEISRASLKKRLTLLYTHTGSSGRVDLSVTIRLAPFSGQSAEATTSR